MPQDELGEVKEALLAARVNNPNENPVFYSKYHDYSETSTIWHLSFPTSCDIRQKIMVPKNF